MRKTWPGRPRCPDSARPARLSSVIACCSPATAATARARESRREEDLKRHLLCLDRGDGRIRWVRDVPALQPEASYTDFLVLHGYASSTPASDGQRVYACFGKSGTRAFDLEGNELWRFDVGSQAHYWGSGGSPILHNDVLLVNAAVESQTLFALDKLTGQEVWRTKGLLSSWSTPVVVDLPDGGQELVLSVRSKLTGLRSPDRQAEVDLQDGAIVCVAHARGSRRDAVRLRRQSRVSSSPCEPAGRAMSPDRTWSGGPAVRARASLRRWCTASMSTRSMNAAS